MANIIYEAENDFDDFDFKEWCEASPIQSVEEMKEEKLNESFLYIDNYKDNPLNYIPDDFI